MTGPDRFNFDSTVITLMVAVLICWGLRPKQQRHVTWRGVLHYLMQHCGNESGWFFKDLSGIFDDLYCLLMAQLLFGPASGSCIVLPVVSY